MYGEYLFIEVPGAPTSFLATPSGTAGLVNFSWTAPADNGGSAITGYDIYRGTTSGTVTTLIGSTTGATTFSYTAPNATNYHYHVRAKNAVSTAASTTSVESNVDTAQAALEPNDAITKNFNGCKPYEVGVKRKTSVNVSKSLVYTFFVASNFFVA
jgi:hypothetical protein